MRNIFKKTELQKIGKSEFLLDEYPLSEFMKESMITKERLNLVRELFDGRIFHYIFKNSATLFRKSASLEFGPITLKIKTYTMPNEGGGHYIHPHSIHVYVDGVFIFKYSLDTEMSYRNPVLFNNSAISDVANTKINHCLWVLLQTVKKLQSEIYDKKKQEIHSERLSKNVDRVYEELDKFYEL
jgi:hypothetical protein